VTQPPPEPTRPDGWLPPSRVEAQGFQPGTVPPGPSAEPADTTGRHGTVRRPRRRWGLAAGAAVLAIALTVTAVLLLRGPSGIPGPELPSGDLPSQPAVPTPAVVAALEKHGLECLDEAYDPWLVKGCYAHADQRIVMVRMKVDASAGIEKFLVQVLDGNVSTATRDAEFGVLLELMMAATDVPAADRREITRSVAAQEVREFERIGWGELYLPAPQPSVRTIILTRADVNPSTLTARPILGSYESVEAALTDLGYSCRTEGDASFICDGKRPGEEFSGAFNDGAVLTLSVWFEDGPPAVDAPILVDAYAMLATVADPHSEAFRQGLARMALDAPEHVFMANCRIIRWEQRFEIGSVDFA